MQHARAHTRIRWSRWTVWLGVLAVTAAGMAVLAQSSADAAPENSGARSGPQHVTYLGHTFNLPSGWTVVDLGRDPNACVRFDVHAIYLGTPSLAQKCATQKPEPVVAAILVEPAGSHGGAASAQDDAIEQRITARLANAQITAAYGNGADRAAVERILTSAGVPTPSVKSVAASAATPPQAHAAATPNSVGGISVAEMTNNYVGLGFDACTAPSTAQMTAWGASAYRAVGVYLGGADRACTQPALTASWVTAETAAGWHLLPLYVGPQVATSSGSQLSNPAAQGTAAANDAVTQAEALGLGPQSLLYYDMEGGLYTAADSTAVESFLNAWTAQLHALGYRSAVYGEPTQYSGALGVLYTDWGKMAEPDVIDVANATSVQNDDPGADPANHWTDRRVHQFVANVNQTYGGVLIQIDEDYLNLFACGPLDPAPGRVTRPQFVRNCDAAR
jgi:hypothetical protein